MLNAYSGPAIELSCTMSTSCSNGVGADYVAGLFGDTPIADSQVHEGNTQRRGTGQVESPVVTSTTSTPAATRPRARM